MPSPSLAGRPEPFDTVIVPDFSGNAPAKFEIRCLFFLASWIENAGAARDHPLHLACIGEPPATVRRLAAACGARVTVHAPLGVGPGPSANKLRALDVARETRRVLLLDADVVVLSDLSAFGHLGDCMALAPMTMPQTPPSAWRKIYRALDLPLPRERIASLRGELGFGPWPFRKRPLANLHLKRMVPAFNSGVVFAAWDHGLLELWREHLAKIPALFREDGSRRPARFSDQLGLATAVSALRGRGVPFETLAPELHTSWMFLYKSVLPVEAFRLYHAYRFGAEAGPGPGGAGRVLADYGALVRRRMRTESLLEHGLRLRFAARRRTDAAALGNLNALLARLEALYGRWIAPSIQGVLDSTSSISSRS